MEDIHDPVSQHSWPRPHFRSHHGSTVRYRILHMDCCRYAAGRCSPRLFLRLPFHSQQRSQPARIDRKVLGDKCQDSDEHSIHHLDGTRWCGIRLRSCRVIGRHDPRCPELQLLDHSHLPILYIGHAATHRQDHRTHLPHIRHRPTVHGFRSTHHAIRQVTGTARDMGGSRHQVRPLPHLPYDVCEHVA